MQEAPVPFLGQEDLLEKEKTTGVVQYSGLENSMDCVVNGVPKSWKQLNDFDLKTSSNAMFLPGSRKLRENLKCVCVCMCVCVCVCVCVCILMYQRAEEATWT